MKSNKIAQLTFISAGFHKTVLLHLLLHSKISTQLQCSVLAIGLEKIDLVSLCKNTLLAKMWVGTTVMERRAGVGCLLTNGSTRVSNDIQLLGWLQSVGCWKYLCHYIFFVFFPIHFSYYKRIRLYNLLHKL